MANYRNKKLLAYARGQSCTMCGVCDGTIVAAHSNSQAHGKGMGIKAHDYRVAFLCARCHDWYDCRRPSASTREWRQARWQAAHEATIQILYKAGLIDDAMRDMCLFPPD